MVSKFDLPGRCDIPPTYGVYAPAVETVLRGGRWVEGALALRRRAGCLSRLPNLVSVSHSQISDFDAHYMP